MGGKSPALYLFEGTWWSHREVPLVLPYFQALQTSYGPNYGPISLSHRTIRTGDDIAYWIKRILRGERAFVYFACHGNRLELYPADGRHPIDREALIEALGHMKHNAVEFLHFGCCEMVDKKDREGSLNELAHFQDVRWVSGYVKRIDWLDSMFLDLALVARLYLPYRYAKSSKARLAARATGFCEQYEQLARQLGFCGVTCDRAGRTRLVPERP